MTLNNTMTVSEMHMEDPTMFFMAFTAFAIMAFVAVVAAGVYIAYDIRK